ncbi:restriction endonuclease subunit S [Micrococcus sp. EYE_162]|uniref:restriction endonuclease subunit S n=1 Tax=unclassified Micrococcus TaxID=2620948 RepID=UPI0020067CBB|nr:MULTISPECIES: restriction endonuclease subunit S [unclassified Micrococcus]MCK6096333.1 restriction endonuclease subunit S [Micrococcus sp. EYE_212]MCK6172455.1 restriction endonuclease subunit S [Micrococcus sp. EYE_162]
MGRALQITERLLSSFDNDVMCASFCKLIRVDPAIADPGFVFRVLQAAYADGKLDAYQVQSTGITNFKWKPFLKHFDVYLPDRDVQERVAAALDVFDDLIENNRRRVEILEEMARSIYREWFVKFRYPGHEDVPMVDSALGLIPDGWEVQPLSAIATVNGSSRKPGGDEVFRYLDISALSERHIGELEAIGGSSAPGRARRVVSPGDTVWATVRPNRRAHALLVAPDSDWIASTGLAVLTPSTVSPDFLFETSSATAFSDWLVGRATGSAYPAVRAKDFEEAPIVVPDVAVDAAFADKVSPMHDLSWRLRNECSRLAALRDLLLPKLVTGQIDVSSLDLDAVISTGSTEESAVAQ